MINRPALGVRFLIFSIAVGTAIGVVAAGITIGVIVGRQQQGKSPFVETTINVVRCDVSIAINRLIAPDELKALYDSSFTLDDLTTSLNERFKFFFQKKAIRIVVSAFSGEPILVSSLRNERRQRRINARPSIIVVNGSAYLTHNYTGAEIRTAFQSYSRIITLMNFLGLPSPALGTFSSRYSEFTDTYPVALTLNATESLVSLSINRTNQRDIGNGTRGWEVSSTTANSFLFLH